MLKIVLRGVIPCLRSADDRRFRQNCIGAWDLCVSAFSKIYISTFPSPHNCEFPFFCFLLPIYPHTHTHSQWPQDPLPELSVSPSGNWLPQQSRDALLSLPSTLFELVLQLPPRLLSPLNSSKPVVSRPLTLPEPRRPSTVGSKSFFKSRKYTDVPPPERADWPKEKLLVSDLVTLGLLLQPSN